MRGRRVLELGSGTGLAGLFAAKRGCHVLLTDVAAVVELLHHNIAANAAAGAPCGAGEGTCGLATSQSGACTIEATPASARVDDKQQVGRRASASSPGSAGPDATHHAEQVLPARQQHGDARRAIHIQCASAAAAPWVDSTPVGNGTAAAMTLDWEESTVAQTCANSPADADFVIACEVIWLADLIDPYVRTLAAVLRAPQRPECYMTYTHRGTASSRTFARVEDVRRCLREHGCEVEELIGFEGETGDGERVSAWRVVAKRDRSPSRHDAQPA